MKVQFVLVFERSANLHHVKNYYKLKYNISYKDNEKDKQINFHSENNMITYLNKNTNYLNTLNHVCLNFKQIKIALSQSRWRIKK